MGMKVRDILRLLKEDGWYLDRTKGSHRQFRHPTKSGTVTVAGQESKDLKKAIEQSILKQAELK
jgi:predicted RNA binding protein YcfA (HicA-like mRNA interferase family)